MGRLVEVEDTIPVPFGRPRTGTGDLAAKLRAGESVLFNNEREANCFRDCIRYYHGNRNATMRKVPNRGWRVWRKA